MSVEEENDFIQMAEIQAPTEHQNKYKELTLKHHDVFSKNDQDIGKAEHFEHNILLKDNKPGC
jgi:hypothetical protein